MDNIPEFISDDEILVRFVFDSHFKKSVYELSRIQDNQVFFDSRGPVSLQRYFYCNENECKKYASLNVSKILIGLLSFKKAEFEEIVLEWKKNREEFKAEIISTKQENPSHADLLYINPAVRNDESPNTAIRLFSRMLFKVSRFIYENEEKTIGSFFKS